MSLETNRPGHVPGAFSIADSGELVPYFPFRIKKEDELWTMKNPLNGQESELNEAAFWMLKLCDGYRTLDEVITEISRSYKTERENVLGMSAPLLENLTKDGVLWWRGGRLNYWKVPAPAGVLWDLTSRCNLRCKHCVVSAGEAGRNELSLDECCRLIDQFADHGVRQLILSGGEPMVRDDFFDIAGYAAQKGLLIQVATNGTMIDENAAKRLSDIGASMQVSFDSSEPAIHDEFRQHPGSWMRTKKGIELLKEAGVPVTLAVTVTTMNIDNVPRIYEMAKDMGVQTFRILPFVPFGRGKYADELEVSPARMKELTEFLHSKRDEDGLNIAPMEFECTFSPPPEQGIDGDTRIGCDGAISYCTVNSSGEVLPCNYFSGADAENIREHDFKWIWDNSRFLNYFRSLKATDMKGTCQECKWLPVCRGSCIAANFAHGDIFQPNCHCWMVNEK
ncbi:radical SAM protein [Methanolobus profundi]|uniref:Radical SAM additional 4Fe4S-binding SPASM domain-containing protein n=1 Tax=Methanolobus profundi TaxID=487685 RepID=A0A1I4PK84_9EURY|nr:PqqD family peptide modification chaperone [Methanolobus profundi]SFM27970.1 radical SAM additional 4Fe4S-binding SPASM domain-containing protein [Methanolobus profundi]